VVGVVCSFYPFLALLLADGTVPADCLRLPKDYERAFAMLQTESGRQELSFLIGKPIRGIDWDRFDRQLDAVHSHAVRIITRFDHAFPPYLRDIPKSPPLLFYKGDLSYLAHRGVAIVGSRRASVRGSRFATGLASDLAALGVTVVSGAARGH
jgi:predicted Rossmann fold nucleotide-binding protein DprA/Smf involved in DNA uptake